jgi:thiamine-phosphate pyrophosphorylase
MLPTPPILVISDRRQAPRPLAEVAAAVFAAGCRWFSLREKDLPPEEQARLLDGLRPLAAMHGARLGLHGSAAQARSFGLSAIHLPGGADPCAARHALGPEALIGLSLHAGEALSDSQATALDYVTLSPVFESRSKPGRGPVLGLSGLSGGIASLDVPVLALGGIEGPEQAADCRRAGAAGIALMGAVMRGSDPGGLFERFREAWEEAG